MTAALAALWVTLLVVAQVIAAPSASASHLTIQKLTTTVVATNAQTPPLLNGQSFQQDSILSHAGWQYVAYYSQAGSVRRVSVARRQIGSGSWAVLQLNDYSQTIDDAHNTISMGVSPGDGRLHLAFDHHESTLHYRKSVAGLVNNPSGFTWQASLFGPVLNNLCGPTVTNVTYPRFVTTPGNQLLFFFRIGAAGQGDEHMYRWNTSTGQWSCTGHTGVVISGQGQQNAYLNGVSFDPDGRLHLTWVWRETIDPVTNHDLMYAYSDDNGQTWKNNAGVQIGDTPSVPITSSSPGVKIWTIPQGSNLSNQEGQFAPGGGRVHVVMRENVSGSPRYIHYYRNGSGTWVRRDTGVAFSNRSKIVTDPAGNAYILAGNIRILGATAASNFTDWGVIASADNGLYFNSPLYDHYRLTKGDGKLSIVYQGLNSSTLYNLNYAFGN